MSQAADLRARHCALAYLSDGSMMFNALRPHGRAFTSHRATSLDHTVWFHDDADPAEWLLFDQQGPVAADARGLNQGRIFAGDGRLVASVAQEAMMRRL
jgi:acyl-CoA thioesterase-2